MAEIMTARVYLVDSLCFTAESGSGHYVLLDAATSGGGENRGFRPMEMLLVGLAGCTGMDVISILRKKRQAVSTYEVVVTGRRAQDHPMVFEQITVEHVISGQNIQPEAVARAIALSRGRYCGAGAMLGRIAHLTHTYRILETEKEETPVLHAALV